MTFIHQTAVITNANGRHGLWTVQALASTVRRIVAVVRPDDLVNRDILAGFANVEIVEKDLSDEAGWQSVCDQLGSGTGSVDVVVHAVWSGEGPFSTEEAITASIMEPWLTAKYALHLMREKAGGIIVIQGARPHASADASADAMVLSDGEQSAMRVATAAMLLDAVKTGVRHRLNRLIFDADVGEGSFKAAVRVLTDARSSFMTGAELELSANDESDVGASDDLAGKTVLVTGATSGIGRATAIEAGRKGAWVAVGGRKLDLADQTLSEIRAAGGDGMVVPLDVTVEDNWRSAIDAIVKVRGTLHGLVNNAGESRNRPIDELTAGDLDFLLSINYRACLLGMTHARDIMQQSKGGSIVNVTSVAGLRAGPGGAAYGASKAGAIGLSRGFANATAHMSPRVRVNALQPGFIWSESVVDALGREGADSFRAMIEPRTPLGRVGTPGEVAHMAVFLLSDAARAISGQMVNVSGGLELNFP